MDDEILFAFVAEILLRLVGRAVGSNGDCLAFVFRFIQPEIVSALGADHLVGLELVGFAMRNDIELSTLLLSRSYEVG